MNDRLKKCEDFRECRSIPSVSEKGKTYQLDNKKKKYEIGCIKIDGCVFDQTEGIKCDYLFEIKALNKIIYIELKGSDVVHAIKQIHVTVDKTKKQYKGWKFAARLVLGNRVPASTYDRNDYEKLVKLIGRDIIIKHESSFREAI